MSGEVWRPLDAALDRAATAGRMVDLWLRDDDAVAPSPALERLIGLCEATAMPVLLAVIPAGATPALASLIADLPLITPAQHGYDHRNHAQAGERARELGGQRLLADTLDDLRRGRDRLSCLFGPRVAPILVPPWNRIDDAVWPALPALGFEAISTFGPAAPKADGLAVLNTDLDIIDWRHGRVGRPHAVLIDRLATLIDASASAPRPLGLLTHHLVHDDTAWSFLETCLPHLAAHPAVRFRAAVDLYWFSDLRRTTKESLPQ